MTRLAAVLAILLAALAPLAAAHGGRSFWSHQQLVRTIAGTVINVEGKRVRIAAATVTCVGEGRRVVRRGVRQWKHFSCTQPNLFPGDGALAGPDAVFRVHVLGVRRYVISDAHFAE